MSILRIEDVPKHIVKEIKRRHILQMIADSKGDFNLRNDAPKYYKKFVKWVDYFIITVILSSAVFIAWRLVVGLK